jgi:hypothetical protein
MLIGGDIPVVMSEAACTPARLADQRTMVKSGAGLMGRYGLGVNRVASSR